VEFDLDPVGNDRPADQSNVEEIAGHGGEYLDDGTRAAG
jgi:hypothetical protein